MTIILASVLGSSWPRKAGWPVRWGYLVFAYLKKRLENQDEARHGQVFEYLEVFYNRQRRHRALGYKTPLEFEQLSNRTVA